MSNYKYYIDGVEVFPLNKDKLKFKFERKTESSVILEHELETNLIFNYISGLFNFQNQEANGKCEELNFSIERKCGNSYALFYEAIFAVSEGEFDNDQCTFTVKPRIKRELQDDIEVNFLDTSDPVTVEANAAGVRQYTNCRAFDKTLLYLAKKSNPLVVGIISNFFQINPLVVSADCLPGVVNYYKYLAFANLSDIQEPIPSNLSTRGMVSFAQVMDDLKIIFGVEWYIDDGYNLRIEHETLFEGVQGLDLTQSKYSKYMDGTDKYSYDLDEYPRQEEFKVIGHDQFVRLTYSGVSRVKKNKNSKSYSTTKIHTDYVRIFNGGNDGGEGLFLFACDVNYNMLNASANGLLKPFSLVKNFHTYSRPDLYAVMEAIDTDIDLNKSSGIIFNSLKPTKKQAEISFPFCCEDEFDFKKQILTPMGLGYVDKGSFETQDNLFKTTLLYKVNNCSGFQPTDLDGLQLWLKYNEGLTLVGTAVSQWNDFSGNNRHAVQATPANKPVYVANNYIRFGPGKYMTTPAFQLFPNKRGTIIVLFDFVGQALALAPFNSSILSTNDGGAAVYFDISLSNTTQKYFSVTEAILYPQNIDGFNQQNGGLYVLNRYEDIKVSAIQNSIYAFDNPGVISNTQITSKPLIIGENLFNIASGNGDDIDIKEILIYDRSLSDYEIEQISFYLIKKGFYTRFFPVFPSYP